MKISNRIALVLCALVALTAARKGELAEYAGEELQPEQGAMVLRVEWKRETKGGVAKMMTKDDDHLFIVLRDAVGKGKFVVPDADKIRAFVLPAGRWYVAEMYTPGERNLPKIAKTHQSFEVLAGKVNYAGVYTIRIVSDPEGRASADVSVEYGPDLVKEATDAFPQLFQSHELVYCPIGRKCKRPSEFKF